MWNARAPLGLGLILFAVGLADLARRPKAAAWADEELPEVPADGASTASRAA